MASVPAALTVPVAASASTNAHVPAPCAAFSRFTRSAIALVGP